MSVRTARLLVAALLIAALAAFGLVYITPKVLMAYWFGVYRTEEEAIRICGKDNVGGDIEFYQKHGNGELIAEPFWTCRRRAWH